MGGETDEGRSAFVPNEAAEIKPVQYHVKSLERASSRDLDHILTRRG
jgi:hypothetical protein